MNTDNAADRQTIQISTGILVLLLAGCFGIFSIIDGLFLCRYPTAAIAESKIDQLPVKILMQRIAEQALTPAATTSDPYRRKLRCSHEPLSVSVENKLYASLITGDDIDIVGKNRRLEHRADKGKPVLPKP